jgi:hypothetical protein
VGGSLAGAVLFFFPLYYQYHKFPPTYPIKYANWIALDWIGMDRVYVEDETIAEPDGTRAFPTA